MVRSWERLPPSFFYLLGAPWAHWPVRRRASVSSGRGEVEIVGIALRGSQRVYCEAQVAREADDVAKARMDKRQAKTEELFGEALDLPREERVAFLNAVCRGMPEVQRAEEDLLAGD